MNSLKRPRVRLAGLPPPCTPQEAPASGTVGRVAPLRSAEGHRHRQGTTEDRGLPLVVGVTGASGAVLAMRLLEALARIDGIETHLVISEAARVTIRAETGRHAEEIEALADVAHRPQDIGAAIASGSFATLGMVVIPCSMKTLSAIAHSYAADLLTRAADVTLKEGRPLLLVVREAPLHLGHLRLMTQAAELGAVIFPAVPAFYARPASVDDIVNNIVGRVLARLGVENELYAAWPGLPAVPLRGSACDGPPSTRPPRGQGDLR